MLSLLSAFPSGVVIADEGHGHSLTWRSPEQVYGDAARINGQDGQHQRWSQQGDSFTEHRSGGQHHGKCDHHDHWKKKIVRTRYGKLKGYQETNGSWVWKGVPYADPPAGESRWSAPEDPDAWRGVRDATEPGSECVQFLTSRTWIPSADIVGSEDCLFVDIYRPDNGATNLPVYVFIHGGSNITGSAADYDGSALAARENIVVVVVQYRLGPFGWLSHPAFRDDENELDASGNFGILDQIQALKWVGENIDAFGGNPELVTVGGESAGALDTMALLISARASGLFDGAVVESGAPPAATFSTAATGDPKTNVMIDWLLVNDGTVDTVNAAAYRESMTADELETYLRGKCVEDILTAHYMAGGKSAPFLDGNVIPATGFYNAVATGNYNQVPLMIGTNRAEYKAYLRYYGAYVKLLGFPSGAYTWADAFSVFESEDVTFDDVLPTELDKDLYETIAELWTRQWRYGGADLPATAIKNQNVDNPVYSYVFQWDGGGDPDREAFRTLVGACHAAEIPFFFGWDDDLFGWGFSEANQAGREALQGAMMDYLGSFIRTGDPNLSGNVLPGWPQWSNIAGDPKVIVLDADLNDFNISIENSAAADNYSQDIQDARDSFPATAGPVFDAFGLTP